VPPQLSLVPPLLYCLLFSPLLPCPDAAALASASPLYKRQGYGSGLPANATVVDASTTNITYSPVAQTSNGTNLNQPVLISVPEGVNQTSWANYTNATEPYPGASILIGNPTTNGTNTTLAWVGQPAGGLLRYKPTFVLFPSSFAFLWSWVQPHGVAGAVRSVVIADRSFCDETAGKSVY
jgi:hypothetical protein